MFKLVQDDVSFLYQLPSPPLSSRTHKRVERYKESSIHDKFIHNPSKTYSVNKFVATNTAKMPSVLLRPSLKMPTRSFAIKGGTQE
jgi:hypothetical protein